MGERRWMATVQSPLTRVPSSGRRPSVLIVEDERETREALKALLEPHFDTLEAEDGQDAIRRMREDAPDLVLADLVMPRMGGLELLRRMENEHPSGGAALIFLSGAEDEATIVRCLEAGAADFVVKPANGRELIARLQRALRQQRERLELETLAQTDSLTGLANFRALSTRLASEFARAARYGTSLAMLMIDLDFLKTVNDRYGHEAGNRVIVHLAAKLRETLREVDFAARYGGDEFVVLLPHQTSAEAAILGERLRGRLGSLVLAAGEAPFPLSISVGVAAHYRDSPKQTPQELLEAADAALYESKRNGRNHVTVFERDLGPRPTELTERH